MTPHNQKSLSDAYARRASYIEQLAKENTNCYRLFSGKGEGIGGLKIEVYADVAFIYQFVGLEEFHEEELSDIAQWVLKKTNTQSVHLKKFIEDRTKKVADSELLPEMPLAGEKAPSQIEVLENGIKYQIRPFDGFSTGIFLDQRANRYWVKSMSKDKKVLNAFSYTCAFSVSAASAGATVTSVDLSQKYLDWGKANFTLNGLNPEKHYFYAWDIFEFIKKAKKQNEKFDLIILDPPSFSRGKGGTFSLKKDWKKLLLEARGVLKDKGTLFYSCNFHEWDKVAWNQQIENALSPSKSKKVSLPEVPMDFKNEDHPLNVWCAQF